MEFTSDEHSQHAAVRQRALFLGVLTADVRPSDEVGPALVHAGDGDGASAPISRSTPTEYSSVCGARMPGSS